MSKKQNLFQYRNLSKGRLVQAQNALTNMLTSFPVGVKVLTQTEQEMLLRIRSMYQDILGTWDRNGKLLSKSE